MQVPWKDQVLPVVAPYRQHYRVDGSVPTFSMWRVERSYIDQSTGFFLYPAFKLWPAGPAWSEPSPSFLLVGTSCEGGASSHAQQLVLQQVSSPSGHGFDQVPAFA